MNAEASWGSPTTWKILLIHLRLHFQLLLAPIFLWGMLLSGEQPRLETWLAFVAYHLFLYSGTTAFNSYYDRDEGPVGGLVAPPPAIRPLLPFSLVWQALGVPLAALAGWPVLVVYLLIFLAGAAYSHPAIRWKRDTAASLLTVALGQGWLGFAAGWLATRPDLASLFEPIGLLGAAATALLITGFYPISQVYQVEEDRQRGDMTLAVRFGPAVALQAALGLSSLGGLGLVVATGWRFGWGDALLLGAFYGILAGWIVRWGWGMSWERAAQIETYHQVMRLAWVNALGLLAYLLARLLG